MWRVLVKVVADVVFGFVPDVFDGAVGWEVDEVDVLEGVSLTEVGAEVFRGMPYGITGNQQRALVRRLPRVEEGGQVEIGNSSEPFTARTQAIDHLEFASLLDLPPALGDGDRPGPGNGGDIERERLLATDVGFPETAEKNAELGVRIGGGSERGTGVCAQPFLVDDDRGGQAAEKIDVRPVEGGLETLHEGRAGFVDHPLRLGRDGVEDQRRLPGTGNPGEHRETAFRKIDVHVLQVVLPGAADPDQVVGVSGMGIRHGAPRVRRAIGIARFTHPGSRAPGGWDPPEKEF